MKRIVLAASAVLLAGAASADSHDKVKPELGDPVSLRMNMMKNVGKAMGELGAMAKGEKKYERRVAMLGFRVMNAAALGLSDQFPEGSDTGHDTEAKSTIWSDRAGFEAAVAKFIADTAAATEGGVGDEEAFKASFGKVAENCKGCHEDYRIKKE